MMASFDPTKKHVLVTHFFVAGSLRTDSETMIEVGGLDAVPVDGLGQYFVWKLKEAGSGNYTVHREEVEVGRPLREADRR